MEHLLGEQSCATWCVFNYLPSYVKLLLGVCSCVCPEEGNAIYC